MSSCAIWRSLICKCDRPRRDSGMYGRYVATMVVTAFKEHVVLSKNIVQAMRA